jgi:hypothetical protein
MTDRTKSDEDQPEPISPAVLRDCLRSLKLAAALHYDSTPVERGRAYGACANAVMWLEGELKRVGVVA